jgi:hypothetical protein
MNKMICKSKLFLKRNGSTILTYMGGVGVIATSIMAVKATPKALYLLDVAEAQKGEELTIVEKARVAGIVYIPSIITGISTITCIFGADALNKRRQAALLSAYTLLDSSYKEYRKKVTQLYGEDADNLVRESIAKDKYEEQKSEVQDDKKLFFDEFSGRYFVSTMENVIRAEYEVNRALSQDCYVTVNDFYKLLGILEIEELEEYGWSTDMLADMYWTFWLEFKHKKVTMDDGLECYIISTELEPLFDYGGY